MLKKSFVPLCLLAFFTVIVSCQRDGNHSPYINNMTFDEKSEAEVAYKNSSVQCEDKSQCPPYIASIILADESENQGYFFGHSTNYDIGFCSTQLIANNKVLTNRHCVPPSIAHEGADCSAKMMVKFPETNFHGAQDVRCSKVLALSKNYPEDQIVHPDWAILELASAVNRPFPGIDISGLDQNKSFTAYPTYFTHSTMLLDNRHYDIAQGTIKKVDCKTSMNHASNMGYFHPKSDLFGATCDHEIIGGNSGSGIYSADGSVAGVISFAQKGMLKRFVFGATSTYVNNHWTGGSNLSCLREFNSNPSPFCDFDQRDQQTSDIIHILTVLSNSMTVSEEVLTEIETSKANQDFVEWSTPEGESFLDQYGADLLTSEIQNLPPQYRDMILKYLRYNDESLLKYALPSFPRCIRRPISDSENFQLEVPYLTSDASDLEISETGRLITQADLKSIVFDVSYDAEEDVYIGDMQRLDPSLATQLRELREEKTSLMDQCLQEGTRTTSSSGTGCFMARRAQRALNIFIQRNANQRHKIQNEETLERFPRLGTIRLPLCNE